MRFLFLCYNILIMERKTSFLEFLRLLIMSLVSFDTFQLYGKKGQIGGAEPDDDDEGGFDDDEAGTPAGDEGGDDEDGGDEGGDDGGDEDEDDDDNKKKDSDDDLGFGSLAIKELVMVITDVKDFIMRHVMVVVMFFAYGGIYPTIPIMGILAVMFSLLKFVMFKFRKF